MKESLEAGIWASRLGLWLWDWNFGSKTGIWGGKDLEYDPCPPACYWGGCVSSFVSSGTTPFLGSGPKGASDLCFHICRDFSFSCIKALLPASRLISQPWGPNPSFEAQIPASKPKSQPHSQYSSFLAQTSALRFKSLPLDWNPSVKHRSPCPSEPADQYQAVHVDGIGALDIETHPRGLVNRRID